jgi:hypothetical protein
MITRTVENIVENVTRRRNRNTNKIEQIKRGGRIIMRVNRPAGKNRKNLGLVGCSN